MRTYLYVGPNGISAYPIRRGKALDLGLLREAVSSLMVGGTALAPALQAIADDAAREAARASLLAEATAMLADFRIPAASASGALREAAQRFAERAQSLSDRVSAVQRAVRARYTRETPLEPRVYGRAVHVLEDSVIVVEYSDQAEIERYWSIPYSVGADGAIALGDTPVEFEMIFQPKEAAIDDVVTDGQRITQAAPILRARESATAGGVWDIIVIHEGMSLNRNRYRRPVLEAAATLYEGRPIYVNHADPSSGAAYGRGVEELGGFLRGVRPSFLLQEAEGEAPTFAVVATACITLPWLREAMRNAWELDNPGLYGFSHDVQAAFQVINETGGPVADVTQITKVESVDVVTTPAAGGRAVRLVASVVQQQHREINGMNLAQMIEAIRQHRPDLLPKLGATPDTATAEQVAAVFAEAIKPAPVAPSVAAAATPTPATPTATASTGDAALTESVRAELFALRKTNAELMVTRAMAECSLPDKLKARLRTRFESRIAEATSLAAVPTETEVVAMIREAVEDYGALAESGVVLPTARVVETKTRIDNAREALDNFFDPSKPATSFADLYVQVTGDRRFTGLVREAVHLREALATTSWAEIFGDSVTRRLVQDYNGSPLTAAWRGTFVRVVPVKDFRTQRRVRFGGYGNLSSVAQGGAYPMLTSPTDEEATYAVTKRGGTESVTMEMIRNDDVDTIRRIPQRLARSAAQTVHEFAFDFLKDNPTIYDGAALATVGKANLITTALSNSNLVASRTAMRKQADMSNGKRLGLQPRFLFHPIELAQLAFQLTRSDRTLPDSSIASTAASGAESFAKAQQIVPYQVDYWTDADDYAFTESVDNTPIVEVGFLDGQEDPEIVVQDMPAVGQMFSNDQLTWKIRHIYGGAVVDYRGVVLGRV